MAIHRIEDVLPEADWRPIFFGGLLNLNGRTSWFLTDERESRIAEITQRAKGYGLPPITWPTELPASLLNLGRAATVAKREGKLVPFSLAASEDYWARGRDPSTDESLRRLAGEAGMDGDALLDAIRQQDVKDELKRTTEEAHARGVPGVPTVVVGDLVFWGDDRLEEAAAAAASGAAA